MKRILAAMAAVLFAASLAGCSTQAPAPAVTVTQTQAVPVPAAPSVDDRYKDYLVSKDLSFSTVPTSTLSSLANKICEQFRAGTSLNVVAAAGTSSGLTNLQVAAVIAGAVIYYCPDQADNVQAQADA